MIYQNRIHRFKQKWFEFEDWKYKRGIISVWPQYTVEDANKVFSMSDVEAKNWWSDLKQSWSQYPSISDTINDIEKVFALPETENKKTQGETLKAEIMKLERKKVYYDGGEEFIESSPHGRFFEVSEVLALLEKADL